MPRSTPERSSLTPLYLILGVVALAGIGVLLFQLAQGDAGASEPIPVALDPQALSRVQGISKGSADAPVEILEFADYQCPHCAQFASFVEPLIAERYVEPGIVRYTVYDFPLGTFPHSFLAARAARCANEQGHFWEYHDVLYARQPTWSGERDPTGTFVDFAAQVGLDGGDFESCLRSDRYAQEVSESKALGESLGVEGTPTLFVNGKRLPRIPQNAAELEPIIRAEMGGAAPPDSLAAADTTAG